MGGFTSAMEQGFIQKQIKATATKRDADIASRKEIILGVNQYPNINEHIDKELSNQLLEQTQITDFEIEPLTAYRGAMAFEALRYKTDTYALTHKRPWCFCSP
jgi:methylmalonyl-CoA mutase